jgi:hypothetical protein
MRDSGGRATSHAAASSGANHLSSSSFDRKHVVLIAAALGLAIVTLTFTGHYRPQVFREVVLLFGFLAATCLAILSRVQRRCESPPDYLGRCNGPIFERDGLCFTVSLDAEDRTAMFTIMYQNRYDRPLAAYIALRPAGGSVATLSPRIDCGPAGFGVAKFPVAVPARHQGKTVTMEIGVSIEYPRGKGREVRFRAGRPVRQDSQFRCYPLKNRALSGNSLGCILTQAATTTRLVLPSNIAEYVPDEETGHAEELWSLSKSGPSRYAARQ